MTTSPDLGIPFVAESQSQPHVQHNEAILALQVLAKGVLDQFGNTPPVSPSDGDAYIVGAAPTGAWAGRANCIAYYLSGWRFVPGDDSDGTPIAMGADQEGLSVYVADENQRVTWSGAAWVGEGVAPFLPLAGGTLTGALIVDPGASSIRIGDLTAGVFVVQINNDVNGAGSANLGIIADGVPGNITQRRYSTNTGGASNNYGSAGGSLATPAIVPTGKIIRQLQSLAHDGSAFQTVESDVTTVVEATPAVGALGVRRTFNMAPDASATNTEFMRWQYSVGISMYGANVVINQNRVGRQVAYGRSFQTATASNGGTTAASNYVGALLLTPDAAPVAAHTITLPSDPVDGQEFRVINSSATNSITALTVNGNTGQTVVGAPTTLPAQAAAFGGAAFTLVYRGSSPTSGVWYRSA